MQHLLEHVLRIGAVGHQHRVVRHDLGVEHALGVGACPPKEDVVHARAHRERSQAVPQRLALVRAVGESMNHQQSAVCSCHQPRRTALGARRVDGDVLALNQRVEVLRRDELTLARLATDVLHAGLAIDSGQRGAELFRGRRDGLELDRHVVDRWDLLTEVVHLVDASDDVHQKRTRADHVLAHQARSVEAVEKEESSIRDRQRREHDLLDLFAHVSIELLARDESGLGRCLSKASAALHLVDDGRALLARDGSVAVQHAAQPLVVTGGLNADDVALLEQNRSRVVDVEDHQLSPPVGLGHHRDHVGDLAGVGDLAREAHDGAVLAVPLSVLAGQAHQDHVGRRRQKPERALPGAHALAGRDSDGVRDARCVDAYQLGTGVLHGIPRIPAPPAAMAETRRLASAAAGLSGGWPQRRLASAELGDGGAKHAFEPRQNQVAGRDPGGIQRQHRLGTAGQLEHQLDRTRPR